MQACIPNGFLVSIKSASRPTSDEISGVVCFVGIFAVAHIGGLHWCDQESNVIHIGVIARLPPFSPIPTRIGEVYRKLNFSET
jgi:hypothetical protein